MGTLPRCQRAVKGPVAVEMEQSTNPLPRSVKWAPNVDRSLQSPFAKLFDPARGGTLNDQIVELQSPGLQIIMYSPVAVRDLEEGCDYAAQFPDGKDLVDYMNECRVGAIGTRWPTRDYWLHFSSTMDQTVIARASDHVLFGIEVGERQLFVRGGDDLYAWKGNCPDDQLVTLESGVYAVTACMIPYDGDGPVRIYLHFAGSVARLDLGYHRIPELFCEAPVF